jgi:hypothetical protein
MNSRGFTYFAWMTPGRAGHGFVASYTDKEGQHQYLSRGKDSLGNTLFRRFKFKPARRIISIPNSQVDVIDYLRDYPDCLGSPNGRYAYDENGKPIQIGAIYKEINEGKDAQVGIEATRDVQKATSEVFRLEDPEKADELKEISVLTGFYKDDPGLQLFHLLEYAKNNPQLFLEKLNDPTRRAKYIISNGLNGANPVLKRKGFMIFWQEVHLGNNFDDAVQKILSDKTLFKGIEDSMKEAGA